MSIGFIMSCNHLTLCCPLLLWPSVFPSISVCLLVTQLGPTLVTPCTVAHQASLSMGFSRQEYWSGLPFLTPEDLLDPGIKPWSPALQADSLLYELQGSTTSGSFPMSQLFTSSDQSTYWRSSFSI